jgi:glycosyltransferase involved in cell wall biosynthesis
LFNELHRQLRAEGYALKVFFAGLGDKRRKWKIDLNGCLFKYEVLESRAIKLRGRESLAFTYPGLYRILARERPVAIITDGFSVATTKFWLRSLFTATPYLIWSGAIEGDYDAVSRIRLWHRRTLVKRASGFVVYGTLAKEYLMRLGARPEDIHIAINTVDTEFFRNSVMKWRQQEQQSAPHGILYLGDLTERKHVSPLLHAVKILSEIRSDFVLYLVGDGPERSSLESLVQSLRIEHFVRFEGFVQKDGLPEYFARSCCFLFQTRHDIWGLVLVEAMASGLPCIASIHAGATRDLIQDGKTGFALDFSDPGKAAQKVQWILEHHQEASSIGLAGQRFVDENASLRVSARGVVNAVKAVCRQKGQNADPAAS